MQPPLLTQRFFRNLYLSLGILFTVITAFQAAAAQTQQAFITLAQQAPFAQQHLAAAYAQYTFLHTTGLLLQAVSLGFCLATIVFLIALNHARPRVNTAN